MHTLALRLNSIYIFNAVAFWLFGANDGLFELCDCTTGAALHFYPRVPAGMVGVLSLFSNAVFMATKTKEKMRAQIISHKLTACCSGRGAAMFWIYMNRLGHRACTYTHIHIYCIYIFSIYFCSYVLLHEIVFISS